MLEIFAPYSFFISLIISVTFNLLLIFRTNSNWIVVIIANVLLSVVLNLMGLDQFDFLTRIFDTIVDIIVSIVNSLIEGIKNMIGEILPWWYENKK